LIRGSYDLHGQVLVPPLIVAADHPNAHHVLNEGDEIEVAENDRALLHLVENSHKHLFRWARCSAPAIKPEPLPAIRSKKTHGTRGPLPKTTERVVNAIKDDVRARNYTMRQGRLFDGSHRVLQKALKAKYDCGTSTLLDALASVWSESETPTNSDKK
jgi:hypothetical protein